MKFISLCIYLFLQREPNMQQKNNQCKYIYVSEMTQKCWKRSETMDHSRLPYIAKN